MSEVAAITAFASSVKLAYDTAKTLVELKGQIDGAQLKLKLADVISALADAKIEMAAIQDELRAKDDRIRELEGALQIREEVVKQWDAYYQKNADGRPSGHRKCSQNQRQASN